jgi:hypothetical protein
LWGRSAFFLLWVFVFPNLTYSEGAHQDQVFFLLGEGGEGWRESREKRENLVSSSCEREREREREREEETDNRLRSTYPPEYLGRNQMGFALLMYQGKKGTDWPLLFFASLCW